MNTTEGDHSSNSDGTSSHGNNGSFPFQTTGSIAGDGQDGPEPELQEPDLDNIRGWSDAQLDDAIAKYDDGTPEHSRCLGEKARRVNGRTPGEELLPEGVEPLYGFDKPDPMQWTVAGLVPEGHLSMLVGDGGTGKSYLGLHMALCIATGYPFLGRGVRRGRVLYVDQELDLDEQRRRTHRVAEGMDLSVYSDTLEKRIYYLQPDYGLGTEEHQSQILNIVQYLNLDFLLYDSFTMGAAVDVKDESDVVPIVQQIRDWPTTLAIDHVSHATARGGKAATARAFGSVMKRNAARSSLTLAKADTGGYAIQQEKSNFNDGDHRLCYATEFTDEKVAFETIGEEDDRAAGLLPEMSTKDVTLTAVKNEYEALDGPVHAENVVQWRGERDECKDVAVGTVRNHFTALKRRGDVVDADGEGVLPSSAEYGG